MTVTTDLPVGPTWLGGSRWHFLLWAPLAKRVELHLVGPVEQYLPMHSAERGYFAAEVCDLTTGTEYLYHLDGSSGRPDPASRWQPRGIHGPSCLPSAGHAWTDQSWTGVPLQSCILYELHVGTFTPEGTFEAIVPHLAQLKDLGITAIELMPLVQFPGSRNWGYDGVFPFAVQDSYGGPDGLKTLVNACHEHGLGVVLDVVYNHLGPEGNCLDHFGPYFSSRHETPWGPGLNFDGPGSDEVRRFFTDNARQWIREFHIDALRLDAVHAIADTSASPFLAELAEAIHEEGQSLGRKVWAMAESVSNDPRLVQPTDKGGLGLDAQWSDDFHHALHALLTGERQAYYQDFGRLQHLAKAFSQGFVFTGQYSAYRKRRHGAGSRPVPADKLIVYAQNHDQVGNRSGGERLTRLVSFEALKLAAGVVLLSPFLPLLFMGEEYGETAPFLYFVSHSDAPLIEAVRRGRRRDVGSVFGQEPPDPQAELSFQRSKLDHSLRESGWHGLLRDFYRELIRLRKELPPLALLSKEHLEVESIETVLYVRRRGGTQQIVALFNFSAAAVSVDLPLAPGTWRKQICSADPQWSSPEATNPAVPGATFPEVLEIAGPNHLVAVNLSALAFVLWSRE